MKPKEKILHALQTELEPLGYRYLKSKGEFKKICNSNITTYISYEADCFYRGCTDVTLRACANYKDIDNPICSLNAEYMGDYKVFRIVCRMQCLMPEGEDAFWDFHFRDSDSEEVFNQKLEKLICRLNTILLPYIERLSNKDTAIEEMIKLDQQCLVFFECVVPVMYCVWKHDKKKALEYLEQRRLQLLSFVKPWEWDKVEAFRNGERFRNDERPVSAANYLDYMTIAEKFKKWADEQEWD